MAWESPWNLNIGSSIKAFSSKPCDWLPEMVYQIRKVWRDNLEKEWFLRKSHLISQSNTIYLVHLTDQKILENLGFRQISHPNLFVRGWGWPSAINNSLGWHLRPKPLALISFTALKRGPWQKGDLQTTQVLTRETATSMWIQNRHEW